MTDLKLHWILKEITNYQQALAEKLVHGPDLMLVLDALDRLKSLLAHPSFPLAWQSRDNNEIDVPKPARMGILFKIDDNDVVLIEGHYSMPWKEVKEYLKKIVQEKALNEWEPNDDNSSFQ